MHRIVKERPLWNLLLLAKIGKISAISARAMIHPPRKIPEKSPYRIRNGAPNRNVVNLAST